MKYFFTFVITFLYFLPTSLSAQCANAFTKNTKSGSVHELTTKELTWPLKNNFDCKIRFENSKDGSGILMSILEERPRFTMALSDQVIFVNSSGEKQTYSFTKESKRTTTTTATGITYTNTLSLNLKELAWLRDNEIVQVNFINMIEVQTNKYALTTADKALFKQIVKCFVEELDPSSKAPTSVVITEPSNESKKVVQTTCTRYIKDKKLPSSYPLVLVAKPNFNCKIYFENAKQGLIGVVSTTEPFVTAMMSKGDKLVFTSTKGVQRSFDFIANSEKAPQDKTTDHVTYVNTIQMDAAGVVWLSENDVSKVGFGHVATLKMPTYLVAGNHQSELKQLSSCFFSELQVLNPSLATTSTDKNASANNSLVKKLEETTVAETVVTSLNNNNFSANSLDISDLMLSPEALAKKYAKQWENELQNISDPKLRELEFNDRMGTILFEQKQYRSSGHYLNQVLSIMNSSTDLGVDKKPKTEAMLAHILVHKEQYELASKHNSNALNAWVGTTPKEDLNLMFQAYLNQGEILQNLEPSDANLSLYEKSAPLAEKDWKKALQQRKLPAISHRSIPEKSMDFNLALLSFKQAEELIVQFDKKEQTDKQIAVLMATGNLYFEAKEYSPSKTNYVAALDLMKQHYSTNHPLIAEANRALAEISLAQLDYDKAIDYMNQAQVALLGHKNPLTEATIQQVANSPIAFELIELVTSKGVISIQKNTSEEALKKVLEEYQIASKLLVALRQTHRNESTDYQLDEATDKISQQAVVICHKLHQLTQKEEYLNQIFDYAELSKSGAVYEISQDLKSAVGIPKEEIIKENGLKSQLAYLKNQVLEELKKGVNKDDIRLKNLEKEIAQKNKEHQDLLLHFEKKYPKYHALKYTQKSIQLKDLQAVLKPNEVFLEYVVTDSFIYVLAISNTALKSQLNKLPKPLSLIVRKLQYGLRKNEETIYSEYGFMLYEQVIGELVSFIDNKNLIIAPDAELYYIPFGVLPSKKNNSQIEKGYHNIAFFIQQHAICYNHSAAAFLSSKQQPILATSYPIATWAPQFSTMDAILKKAGIGEHLEELPGAEKEANLIAKLFGSSANIGLEATESNFKTSAGDFGILHLATHGILNDEDPLFSCLVMTNDATDDGLLYAQELYNMKLNANLAVLSACNSGMGKLSKAEGVVGVASGFAYAGVPNIVMSKWPVSDMSTLVLMQSFYDNLIKGMPKDVALQQAKITYLDKFKDKDKLLAPFFWGGFVLSGNPDAINVSSGSSSSFLYIIIIVVLLALFAFLFYKKRQQSASSKV